MPRTVVRRACRTLLTFVLALLTVLGHVAAGRLRPIVHTTLPLAAAADGHRLLEARAAFGKVVLTVAA